MTATEEPREGLADLMALSSTVEEAALQGDSHLVLDLGCRLWATALGLSRTWACAIDRGEGSLRGMSACGLAAETVHGSHFRLAEAPASAEAIQGQRPLLRSDPGEWAQLSRGPIILSPLIGMDGPVVLLVGDAAALNSSGRSPNWLDLAKNTADSIAVSLRTAQRISTVDQTVAALEARVQELEGAASQRQRDQRFSSEERELLRRATSRLHTVLDHLPLALVIVQAPSGAAVLWNRAAMDMLGLDGSGHPTYRLFRADGSPYPPGRLPGDAALAGRNGLPAEVTVEIAPGRTRNLLVSAAPLLDAFGQVEEAVMVMQDVSRLKEVDQLKSVIISLVSHELRTPLHHIKGFSSTLLAPDLSLDDGTRQDLIQSIEQEANRMISMVTDLLDLAKIEAGEAERAEKFPVDPGEMLHTVIRRYERLARGRAIRLELSDPLPEVPIDRGRIERVLTNLLDNAVRFSPLESSVVVSTEATRSDLVIRVVDQGKGIAPEERDRVFDRFYRGRGVAGGGAGLGLSICKAIVEAHGGQIWIEDSPRQGTTLAFSLPLASEKS